MPRVFALGVEVPFDLPGIIEAAAAFTEAAPEGGRRGQALVAAALDLVHPDVRTARVNDPSRVLAGDVVGGTPPVVAVEVKQRAATPTELLQFAERLRGLHIRAVVAALDPHQPALDVIALSTRAWNDYGVVLEVITGTRGLLQEAFRWSSHNLEYCVQTFPRLFGERLAQLEVSPRTLEGWAELVRALASQSEA